MRSCSTAACGRPTSLVIAALVLAITSTHAWAQGAGSAADPLTPTGGIVPPPKDPTTSPGTTTPDPAGSTAPQNPAGSTASPDPAAQPATPGVTTDDADTSDMPVNLRLRRLEQRVQALKERAWRAKARVGMLKEAVLGGGVGATASVIHRNKMGNSFRLVKLVYALDGTQIFARADDSGSLHKNETFEVLTGPIAPGSHTISVLAVYRGHGYGVFKYLTKYKFTVRSSHTFTVSEGKATRIEAIGFEKGGVTTPLEDRPAMDFKVSHIKGPGGN